MEITKIIDKVARISGDMQGNKPFLMNYFRLLNCLRFLVEVVFFWLCFFLDKNAVKHPDAVFGIAVFLIIEWFRLGGALKFPNSTASAVGWDTFH